MIYLCFWVGNDFKHANICWGTQKKDKPWAVSSALSYKPAKWFLQVPTARLVRVVTNLWEHQVRCLVDPHRLVWLTKCASHRPHSWVYTQSMNSLIEDRPGWHWSTFGTLLLCAKCTGCQYYVMPWSVAVLLLPVMLQFFVFLSKMTYLRPGY